MSRKDIVPVETEKTFERKSPFGQEDTSIRDVMESHIQDLEFEDSDSVISSNPHEPLVEASTEADDDAQESSPRERGADGKFIKSKKVSEAHESGEERTIETKSNSAIESDSSGAPVPVPQSWAADAKDVWNQIPPRAQREFVKRENDLRRGLQQATEKAAQVERGYSDIDEALAPFKEIFDSGTATRSQVIKNFAWWQTKLDNPQSRAQAFRDMAQSYGTSLEQLTQEAAAQPQEPSYVREIRQQNQQLMQLYRQQQQQQEQQTQANRQSMEQSAANDVNVFASEVDASGNLLRPHFKAVEGYMVALMPGLRAENPSLSNAQLLQAAYEKAIWADPSTRELELRKVNPPLDKQRIERARRAQKMVNGEAIGPETEDAPSDIRGMLKRNAAKLGI